MEEVVRGEIPTVRTVRSNSAAHAEEVDAANPYGCNQYGEGWKAPHNGRASKPGAPVKKTDPTEEERKQKEEEKRKNKSKSLNDQPFDNGRSALEIRTNLSATEIADLLNNVGYRYGSSRRESARAWEGNGVSRIYFGRDFITIKDGVITNRDLRKVRACTACDDAINAIDTVLGNNDSDNVRSARTTAPTAPAQEWLAPIKQKFLEARKAGASMADLKKMLLTMHPDTKALAKAFANNILAGFAGESEEVDAANPYGCNGSQHKCPQKGTTREGKTPPLPNKQIREQDRGEVIHKGENYSVIQYKDRRKEVHVHSPVTNEAEAKKSIEKLINQCRGKIKGQMRGKPDLGYIAPGEQVEFFVSNRTIKESVENEYHIKRSDNKEAHYTAASVIDKLWETSQEGIRRKPKKDTPKDDEIKWVHERYATLKIHNQKYRVKITAFEYKKRNYDNLLYDIKVQKKR